MHCSVAVEPATFQRPFSGDCGEPAQAPLPPNGFCGGGGGLWATHCTNDCDHESVVDCPKTAAPFVHEIVAAWLLGAYPLSHCSVAASPEGCSTHSP